MQLRFLFLAGLTLAAAASATMATADTQADTQTAAALNDVSVLLPLPAAQDFAQLLSPADQGAAGALIPQDLYVKFGRFTQAFSTQDLYVDGFKVIGVRLDPCFAEGYGPQPCRRQIRLIWQPVLEGNHGFTTLDTALHGFYEFTDDREWQAILQAWPRLAANSPAPGNSPLQVHPQIKAETLNGPSWRALKQVILQHCGEQRLVRLTAMSSNATSISGTPAIIWVFQGYNIPAPKQYVRMRIPRIKGTTQVLINQDKTGANYRGEIQPAPLQPAWNNLLDDSIGEARAQDIKSVMDQAFQNENPRKENPGTIDCVSCHVSQGVRHWGETHLTYNWNWSQDFKATKFQSPLNLTNLSTNFGTNSVRSFGYFGQDPVISQRLINETAVIVSAL